MTEIFFKHFLTISVQVLCDKVRGEGGSQNMILYDTGGGGESGEGPNCIT